MKNYSHKVVILGLDSKNNAKIKAVAEKYFDIDLASSENYDFAILVGGDGTILDAKFKPYFIENGKPVLKIHCSPNVKSLGYTIDVNESNMETAFKDINNFEHYVVDEPVLEVFKNEKLIDYAINEVALSPIKPNKTVMWKTIISACSSVTVSDLINLPTPKCGGAIISSAYGSTAWNLAVNGPVVVNHDARFIDNFYPMLLTFRESPLKPEHYVISPNSSIILEDFNGGVQLFVDRSIYSIRNEKITVKNSDKGIKLIKTLNTHENMTSKLIKANKYRYELLDELK